MQTLVSQNMGPLNVLRLTMFSQQMQTKTGLQDIAGYCGILRDIAGTCPGYMTLYDFRNFEHEAKPKSGLPGHDRPCHGGLSATAMGEGGGSLGSALSMFEHV